MAAGAFMNFVLGFVVLVLLVSARKRTAWPHGKPGRRDGPG